MRFYFQVIYILLPKYVQEKTDIVFDKYSKLLLSIELFYSPKPRSNIKKLTARDTQ